MLLKMSFSVDFFFFFSFSVSLTPWIYLVILRKGVMPRLRSTGMNKESSLTFSCRCKFSEMFNHTP